MRRVMMSAWLIAVTACGAANGTAPSGSRIQVQLREASSASAGRNMVSVSPTAGGETIAGRTDVNGRLDIHVAGAGTYEIRVIPRAGFVSHEGLTQRVSVPDGGIAVARFVLLRESGGGEIGSSGW